MLARVKSTITQLVLRATDALSRARGEPNPDNLPQHLQTGRSGEEAAYFYLREHGYVMVARNFRSPRHRGEIDLIGWDGEILCFIEVKTRGEKGIVPAEMAVDSAKRSLLRLTARDYLRRVKGRPQVRFDVVSLYFHSENAPADITLFKNAFPMS
jgi:putative endonuclease